MHVVSSFLNAKRLASRRFFASKTAPQKFVKFESAVLCRCIVEKFITNGHIY
jgi:hypothetical protein